MPKIALFRIFAEECLDEVTVNAPVGSRVYLCSHTDGSHSIIKDYPKHGT